MPSALYMCHLAKQKAPLYQSNACAINGCADPVSVRHLREPDAAGADAEHHVPRITARARGRDSEHARPLRQAVCLH